MFSGEGLGESAARNNRRMTSDAASFGGSSPYSSGSSISLSARITRMRSESRNAGFGCLS